MYLDLEEICGIKRFFGKCWLKIIFILNCCVNEIYGFFLCFLNNFSGGFKFLFFFICVEFIKIVLYK